MYLVKINNMKFYSHIGVFNEEKVLGQALEIDMIVSIKMDRPLHDNIKHTVNYAECYGVIERIVKESRVNLIETLVITIIDAIKKISPLIDTVQINIRKLAVPIDGIFDNVEVQIKC